MLQQLIDFIAPYEQRYPKSEGKLTEMLTKLQGDIDRTHNSLSLTDEEIVARFGRGNIDETDQKKIFSSGYVVFTLGIVYALFLREQDMQAIIDAVNI